MRRELRILALLAVVGSVLSGCAALGARDTAPANETRTIESGGLNRSYIVHTPGELAAEPSLVIVLHGGFGSASQAQSAYGWDALANREGVVVAYPNGIDKAWNAGSCCGSPVRDDVDDVAFISQLTADLQAEFDIPASRTFATGMSNGAMMAYRMACETTVFSAIAPVAGTIAAPCDGPQPTSVMHIHGLEDERVRYDGETGSGVTRVDGLAVEDAVALWRAADDCDEPVVTEESPVVTSSSQCADGREVSLITIADAGHQWPGADGSRVADPHAVSTAIDATETIWAFFDR